MKDGDRKLASLLVEPISGAPNFEMKVKYSFVNKSDKTLHSFNENSNVLKMNNWKMKEHWGSKSFISHELLIGKQKLFFPDEKLHWRIEIYYIIPPTPYAILNEKTRNFEPSTNFEDPFEMMVNNDSENILLEAENGNFILKSNKAISHGKMKISDNLDGTKEFDKKTILELLRFITFKTVKDIEAIDFKLLEIAMFYEVKELPELCMRSILDNLGEKNILQTIHIAVFYDIQVLFDFCCEVLQM